MGNKSGKKKKNIQPNDIPNKRDPTAGNPSEKKTKPGTPVKQANKADNVQKSRNVSSITESKQVEQVEKEIKQQENEEISKDVILKKEPASRRNTTENAEPAKVKPIIKSSVDETNVVEAEVAEIKADEAEKVEELKVVEVKTDEVNVQQMQADEVEAVETNEEAAKVDEANKEAAKLDEASEEAAKVDESNEEIIAEKKEESSVEEVVEAKVEESVEPAEVVAVQVDERKVDEPASNADKFDFSGKKEDVDGMEPLQDKDVSESDKKEAEQKPTETDAAEETEEQPALNLLVKMDSLEPVRHSIIVVTPPGDNAAPQIIGLGLNLEANNSEKSENTVISELSNAPDVAWDTYMDKRDPTASPKFPSRRKSRENRTTPPAPLEPPPALIESDESNKNAAVSENAWNAFMQNRKPASPRQPVPKRKSMMGEQPPAMIALAEERPALTPDNAWDALMRNRTSSSPRILSKRKSANARGRSSSGSKSKEMKDPTLDSSGDVSASKSPKTPDDALSPDVAWDLYMNNRQESAPKIQSKRKSAVLLGKEAEALLNEVETS